MALAPGAGLTIHQIRRGDARRVREVRLRALHDTPAAFASTFAEEAAWPDSHWTRLAADSDQAQAVVVFAAVGDDRWMGMAAGRWFDREAGTAQLWGMWVDPGVRRSGIGERLVNAVQGWARDRGAHRVRLGVMAETASEAFYVRLGFVRTGETRPLLRGASRTAIFLARAI